MCSTTFTKQPLKFLVPPVTMSYQINKVIFLYKVRIYVFFFLNYKKDQSYL